jgi:hypothetical protein
MIVRVEFGSPVEAATSAGRNRKRIPIRVGVKSRYRFRGVLRETLGCMRGFVRGSCKI